MKLLISYNPYLMDIHFKIDGKCADKTPWAQYLRRHRLQTWFHPAPNWKGFAFELQEALNAREVEIEFIGREMDYQDLKLFCSQWNDALSKQNHKIRFALLEQRSFLKDDRAVLQDLDSLVEAFESSPSKTLSDSVLRECYCKAREAVFDLAVVSTMSSGKSTLINALLGRDLLPAANDATTAKITRIHDCDSAEGFTVECHSREGQLLHKKQSATLNLLDEYNNDDKVFYVDLEGDIPSISSSLLHLNILDTPGPNNSATQEHWDVTNTVLHDKERQPIILYVMDSTKPEDESDAALLKDIAETIKRGGKQTQERFVFVMNKADMLDGAEDGKISDVMQRRQDYLKCCGIDEAQIIPVSANAAKLLRMQQSGQALTKKQQGFLMFALSDMHLDEAALLSPACRAELNRRKAAAEQAGDEDTLALISTGIVGLELTINEYLEKYAYTDKIQQIVELIREKMEEKTENFNALDQTAEEKKEFAQILALRQTFEKILFQKTDAKTEVVEEPNKMKLSISYNPYLLESHFKINEKKADKTPWAQYLRRRRLQTWFYPAPNWKGFALELQEALNEQKVELEFTGRAVDYVDLGLFCEQWNNSKDRKTRFILLKQKVELKEDKNVLQELDKLVATFKESPIEELRSEELLKRYQEERKNDFDMAVVATMSSGKSTLINALLGRDLLPAANDATTAKITRIHDCDSAEGFTVECHSREGQLLHKKQSATLNLLDEYNNDDKVFYVDLEGDIPSISSSLLHLNILDTPGPNNSATQEHWDVTNTVLHDKERQPIILYVMDSTKPEDESDAALLKDIAETIKRGGKQTQERFVFVMNKADTLDEAKDGKIVDVLQRRQKYLQRCGIDATQIIPVSAQTALLLRMPQNGQELSKKQKLTLAAALEGMNLDEAALLSPACRAELNRMKAAAEQAGDEDILALISTGVVGLELTINEYLEKYAYPYKINRIIETFSKKLNEEEMHSKYAAQLAGSEEELKKAVEALQKATVKKKELEEKQEEIEKEINAISFDRKPLSEFCSEFEKEAERALLTKMNKDVSVGQKHSLLKELTQLQQGLIDNAQEVLYKMLNGQIHQKFDPVYEIIRELQNSFKQLTIEGVDFSKVEGLTNLDDILGSIERADLSDVLNDGDYTYQKSHLESRGRDNPERMGFWGAFKFWKPKTITETVEVSDGEYIDVKRLYNMVIQEFQVDFDKRVKALSSSYTVFFQNKQKECVDFLKMVSEEQTKELDCLRFLTEQVQNSELNIEGNKKRIQWIENCSVSLNRIV